MSLLDRILDGIKFRVASFWSNQLSWGSLSASSLTTSGVVVSPESALSYIPVYSAIQCISTDTAFLPVGVFRRRPDGGRDEERGHPVWNLLNVSPDGETTAMRHRQAGMGHVLGWGNSYTEVEFSGGYPKALYLLDAVTQPQRRPQDHKRFYKLRNGTTLPPGKVLHVAGLGYDGLLGYSPVTLARQSIGVGIAAETMGASLFGNGAIPKGVLTYPKRLSEIAQNNLRTSINKVHQGPQNANNIMILEEGAEWVNTQINPDDAQFLQTRQFQVIDVARLFRVPPHKIGDYSQAHLANLEESNLDYMMTTLLPWCEQIEQEWNLKLFTPAERAAGFFVEHNLAAFMRGNMAGRAEFYTKLRDLGVLTPNLICRFENMNPIGPEGDVRLVPLNMTNLKNAGKPTPTAAPGKAPSDRFGIAEGVNGHAEN